MNPMSSAVVGAWSLKSFNLSAIGVGAGAVSHSSLLQDVKDAGVLGEVESALGLLMSDSIPRMEEIRPG